MIYILLLQITQPWSYRRQHFKTSQNADPNGLQSIVPLSKEVERAPAGRPPTVPGQDGDQTNSVPSGWAERWSPEMSSVKVYHRQKDGMGRIGWSWILQGALNVITMSS